MGIGFIPNEEPFGTNVESKDEEREELNFAKIWQHDLESTSDASREASEDYKRFFKIW